MRTAFVDTTQSEPQVVYHVNEAVTEELVAGKWNLGVVAETV